MPYYFFRERPDKGNWELIFQADSFDEVRAEQQRLRELEKVDRRVVQVIHAMSEKGAKLELGRMRHYGDVMRPQPSARFTNMMKRSKAKEPYEP